MVIYKCDLCGNTLGRDATGIIASQFIFIEKQQIARGFRIPKENKIPLIKIEQLFCPDCTNKIRQFTNDEYKKIHTDASSEYNKLSEKK